MKRSQLQEPLPRITTKEKILAAAIVWLFGLIGFAAYLGLWPRTHLGWIIFLFVAPPLFIVAEALGELLGEFIGRIPLFREMNDSIERATREKRFSWLRVFYYFVVISFTCVVIITAMMASQRLFGAELEPIKQFFKRHFIAWY